MWDFNERFGHLGLTNRCAFVDAAVRLVTQEWSVSGMRERMHKRRGVRTFENTNERLRERTNVRMRKCANKYANKRKHA